MAVDAVEGVAEVVGQGGGGGDGVRADLDSWLRRGYCPMPS